MSAWSVSHTRTHRNTHEHDGVWWKTGQKYSRLIAAYYSWLCKNIGQTSSSIDHKCHASWLYFRHTRLPILCPFAQASDQKAVRLTYREGTHTHAWLPTQKGLPCNRNAWCRELCHGLIAFPFAFYFAIEIWIFKLRCWPGPLYASIDSVHQRPMNMLVKWPSTPTQALSVDANSSDYVALASIVYNAMENGRAAWYDIALDFGSAWSMQRGWRQRLSFFSVVVSASSVVEHVNFVKHKTNCGDGEVI